MVMKVTNIYKHEIVDTPALEAATSFMVSLVIERYSSCFLTFLSPTLFSGMQYQSFQLEWCYCSQFFISKLGWVVMEIGERKKAAHRW